MLTLPTGINLMVSDEEMLQLGQTSLAMSDGSGYLATLGVYHELHCVVSHINSNHGSISKQLINQRNNYVNGYIRTIIIRTRLKPPMMNAQHMQVCLF